MPTDATGPTSRPYRHGDVPRALVEAALATLERTGTPDFTLRSLARDIGVTHAAPYAHFTGKDAVLEEVRQIGYERLVAAMREAADGLSGTDRITSIGCTYVAFGRQNPGLYRLMFSGTDFASPALDAIRGASASLLTGSVDAVLPDAPTRVRENTSLALFALVHGLTSLILDGRVDPDDERIHSMIAATLPRG